MANPNAPSIQDLSTAVDKAAASAQRLNAAAATTEDAAATALASADMVDTEVAEKDYLLNRTMEVRETQATVKAFTSPKSTT